MMYSGLPISNFKILKIYDYQLDTGNTTFINDNLASLGS